MVEATDVSHEDADLAIVDFASVTTPLALDPHRMRPPLGKTARIKGDDAIGFAEPIDDLPNQHLDQRPVVPWCGANEFLHDLSLHIDERRDVLGILAGQVRQQPLEVEMDVALPGLGLKRLLIGHHELAQTVHHLMEHVGGHKTIAQQFLSPLCPRRCHLFASTK